MGSEGLAGAAACLTLLSVQLTGLQEITGEIDFDALMIGTEVKRQLPFAMGGAQHVGQVALDAVLPDVLLQGGEQLGAALGAEPDQAGHFPEDGAFEMPYLADLGFAPAYRGRREIAGFFQFVRDLYPGFEFEHLKVLIDTPDQVFAE